MARQTQPKHKINWRYPICGGIDVHGLSTCFFDEVHGWHCECVSKPSNFNYEAHFALALEIDARKVHLSNGQKIGVKWVDLQTAIFGNGGAFQDYQPIQSETLKEKLKNMFTEVLKRHGFDGRDDHRTYEDHPDGSPYDNLLLRMYSELQNQAAEVEAEKEKANHKEKATLFFKDLVCSPLSSRNTSKKTPTRGAKRSAVTALGSSDSELQKSLIDFAFDRDNSHDEDSLVPDSHASVDYHETDHRGAKRPVDTGEANNGFLTLVTEMRKSQKTKANDSEEAEKRKQELREKEINLEMEQIALRKQELQVRSQESETMRIMQMQTMEFVKSMMQQMANKDK